MKAKFALSLSLTALLAACGGGGGDAAAPVVPSTGGQVNAGLQLSVPNPTYAPGSEELAAFNKLNSVRSTCGYGLIAQNTALDTAARGHADWITYNNQISHIQTAGTPRFTGESQYERIVAAGYAANPSLFLAQDEFTYSFGTNGNNKTGYGLEGTRLLLNAPYHANSLLAGFREIGISLRSAVDSGAPDALTPNAGRKALVMNPVYLNSAGSQEAAIGNAVLTYPCQGVTDVNPAIFSESPNPVPGRNLQTNPLGSAVMISVKTGNTLAITSASMTNLSNSQAVVVRPAITGANDPYAPCATGCFQSHQGYIVADAPLAPFTSYQVSINGTNNGVPFSRNFSFTTGNGN